MAYTITQSDGRIVGGYIIVSGEYIPLAEYASRLGFNSWDEFVAVNPVYHGSIDPQNIVTPSGGSQVIAPVSTDNAIQKIRQGAKIDSQTQANPSIPTSQAQAPQAQPAEKKLTRAEFEARTAGKATFGGYFEYEQLYNQRNKIAPPQNPKDRQFYDNQTLTLINPGGVTSVSGLQTSTEPIRNALASQSRRDSVSGGNITDIYQKYLPEKTNAIN